MLPCASCCHGLCVLPCTSVVAMYIASYHLVIVTVYVSVTRPTCLSALQVLSTGVRGGGGGQERALCLMEHVNTFIIKAAIGGRVNIL